MNNMKNITIDQYIENKIRKDPSLEAKLSRVNQAIAISIQIYNLRKQKKLTQAQLAKIARVRQSNIARLENAEYEGYSKKTLEKIAKALDVNLTIFFISKNKVNDINTMLEISRANTTSLNVFPGIGKNWNTNGFNPVFVGTTIAGIYTTLEQTRKRDRELEVSENNFYI